MNANNTTCAPATLHNVSVTLHDGKPTVTSLQVANAFEKLHKNVVRDIDNLQVSKEFTRLNFEPCSYINFNNREMPMYRMTRDGFMFLVMGYTGARAGALKEAYIAEFNRMEAHLNEINAATPPAVPALPADYAAALRALATSVEQQAITQAKLAVTAPKAKVYDNVVADKNMTIARFTRTLRGVNTNKVKRDLEGLGYLYKQGGVYRVYAKYRDTHFVEKVDHRGFVNLNVLDKGKQELTLLYLDGKLTMKKGEKPCKIGRYATGA